MSHPRSSSGCARPALIEKLHHQNSNMSGTLLGNGITDQSDVVGAARRDEQHLKVLGIWRTYIRGLTVDSNPHLAELFSYNTSIIYQNDLHQR